MAVFCPVCNAPLPALAYKLPSQYCICDVFDERARCMDRLSLTERDKADIRRMRERLQAMGGDVAPGHIRS